MRSRRDEGDSWEGEKKVIEPIIHRLDRWESNEKLSPSNEYANRTKINPRANDESRGSSKRKEGSEGKMQSRKNRGLVFSRVSIRNITRTGGEDTRKNGTINNVIKGEK